jgi:hypothetical protein
VSRQDQRLEPQRDVLLADGCVRVFEEKISSRESERGALREGFDYCREGDVLVVAKLDRLGRPLRELIDLVGELESGRVRKLGATTDQYEGAGVFTRQDEPGDRARLQHRQEILEAPRRWLAPRSVS